MESTLKCPECGGAKCTPVSNGKYRCAYCGTVFNVGGVQTSDAPDGAENKENSQRIKLHDKNRIVAILLAFFLGDVGGQFFYLGSIWKGILCVCFCWTWVPGIVGIIHGIMMAVMNDEDFDDVYNYYTPGE